MHGGATPPISTMLSTLRDLFFPKRCLKCSAWDTFLCEECFRSLSFLKTQFCPYCNKPSPGGITHNPRCTHHSDKEPRKLHLNGALAVVKYDDLAKKLIQEFKYYPQVKDLKEVIAKIFKRYFTLEEEYFPYDTTITAVPLHKRRLRERGFNQAQIIAQILGNLWGLETNFNLLERQKDTDQQMGLSRKQRFRNISGAFRIKEDSLRTVNCAPSTVLIVDDVWTTGATLKECCKVLKHAGAPKVWAVTLARD